MKISRVIGIAFVPLTIGVFIVMKHVQTQALPGIAIATSSQSSNSSRLLDILDCNLKDDSYIPCYDAFIASYGKEKTTQQLLKELDETSQSNKRFLLLCHAVSHAIG